MRNPSLRSGPARRTAPVLALWLAGLALSAGAPGALAQSPPAPTDQPATSAPEPTSPPPATAPPRQRDNNDEDEPAPPPPTAELLTAEPEASRTRRPTRTPATTPTPSATPAVAGTLRLTLSALLPEGPAGQPGVRLVVANRDLVPALDTTLELRLPGGGEAGAPRADAGQALPAPGVVRWYLPQLEPGGTAELVVPLGQGSRLPPEATACVLLLSAASPLEHCAVLRLTAGDTALAPDLTPATGPTPEVADPEPTPAAAPALPWGWGLLLAGLGALGVWLGLRLRGGQSDEDPSQGDG